jgi:hypothetical protein
MEERGPRLGWTLGGLGALLWMVILAAVMFAQGNYTGAAVGLAFFLAGVLYIILFAPWKYPEAPFWRIYGGLLLIIILAAVAVLYFWYPEDFKSMQNLRTLFMLFPLFLPIFILGKKTWSGMHRK